MTAVERAGPVEVPAGVGPSAERGAGPVEVPAGVGPSSSNRSGDGAGGGVGPAGATGGNGSSSRGSSGRRRWWIVTAAVVAAAVGGAGYGVAARAAEDTVPALGPGDVTVQVDVEHSLFAPEELRVVEGSRVRFVVVNGDPINHELIVGPPDVHARHANGTEAEHPSIPGEVSVGPNGSAVTTFRFDDPGMFEFACHLPGHYEHGMHGEVEVLPADG